MYIVLVAVVRIHNIVENFSNLDDCFTDDHRSLITSDILSPPSGNLRSHNCFVLSGHVRDEKQTFRNFVSCA